MADDFEQIGNFLSRWSRRKLDTVKPEAAPAAPAPADPAPPAVPEGNAETPATEVPPEAPLPPVESLTPDSDFSPFMRASVDPDAKTAALKQLFKDPRFNVIDPLDTYIEDYSLPDPIPAAMMKTMYQAREHLFSDEEKAAADLEDAAAEEKALADAADALDAEQKPAEDDPHRGLQAAANEAQSAVPTAPDRKDA